tara:strand:- start:28 stop:567 length:540 start_codon:yes stop_codon:yes gene_type:complete
MLIIILCSICIGIVNTLVLPPITPDNLLKYGNNGGNGLVPIQAEAARTLMASWSIKMLSRKGIYPQWSYDSCYEGIQVIGKRESILPPFNSFLVFVYNHRYKNEIVNSHVMLCILNPVNRIVDIHGIIENPDNIYYNKSIIPMVRDFKYIVNKAECKLEILHLVKWGQGIYHFTLSREL